MTKKVLEKYKDKLLFVPIGGTGEIGMNCYLYHYNGKWLMVELGIGFADDTLPGVEIVVPDLSFIEKNSEDLLGLILTHAHEDHIGAVPYLWNELQCPVYTSAFTASILKAKFAAFGIKQNIPIYLIEDKVITIGDFKITAVGLTHSIPEMKALMIEAGSMRIFHTGDWKFDADPILGNCSDEALLKSIGDSGVDLMVCDSTNVFSAGSSRSEGELKISLKQLIQEYNSSGAIIVTTFASNIARLAAISEIASECGRKVALAGRSLWRMYYAAKENGYFESGHSFIAEDKIKNYRREELIVVCTGCQGEPLATMNKLVHGSYKWLTLQPRDLVIFSSKIIPGNDKRIYAIMNKLCKLRVEVLTENDHFVHVSGHPSRDELSKMYRLVRPKMSIPMHGEAVHLHEHTKFARDHGVGHTLEVENGHVVDISSTGLQVIDQVKVGCIGINGNYLLPSTSNIFKHRLRMKDNGLMIITIIMDAYGQVLKAPSIMAPGLLDENDDGFIKHVSNQLLAYIDSLNVSQRKNSDMLTKGIRGMLKKIIINEVGKPPYIVVNIEKI